MGATTFNRYRRRAAVEAGVVAEAAAPAEGTGANVKPPREGRGSGKQAWTDFALHNGFVEADLEGLTRDEIADLVDANVTDAADADTVDSGKLDNVSTATGAPEKVAGEYPADASATGDGDESGDPFSEQVVDDVAAKGDAAGSEAVEESDE